MKIEIFGPGCPKCFATETNIRGALKKLKVEAEVIHVRDLKEFAKRGVMFTPAVFVDGQQMVAGHVPTVEEICEWFAARSSEKNVPSELHLG